MSSNAIKHNQQQKKEKSSVHATCRHETGDWGALVVVYLRGIYWMITAEVMTGITSTANQGISLSEFISYSIEHDVNLVSCCE